MDKRDQIRQSLLDWIKKAGPKGTMLLKVDSVSESDYTCVLSDPDTDLKYEDVRLRPVLDGKESITVFPKQGTWALAVRIEDADDWQIISVGEADKWKMSIGTAVIEQDSSGLLIQKGQDTLKDIINLVIEAVMQIAVLQGNPPNYQKLSQALTKLNNVLK